MKIKLDNKVYEKTKFMASKARNLLEITSVLENREKEGVFKVEDFDLITEFIVNCFENEFTSDDLLNFLEYSEIQSIFYQIAEQIYKKTNDKMGKLAKK